MDPPPAVPGLPAALAATLAHALGDGALPGPSLTLSPAKRAMAATLALDTVVEPGPPEASQPAWRLPRIALAGEGALDEAPAELELTGLLGEGGMGRVDLAVQLVFGRTVAVKRVRPDRKSVAALRALVHEAGVTGALEHPNIVPAYAFGQSAEGEPLLVMKRVEGVPWSTLLREPEHPAWQGSSDRFVRHLEVLRQACNAVEAAHRRGVVHRDIKPDNVMVGELGEVYVLDWGIAVRLADPRSTELAGTPAYMAPEMLDGSATVSARTDVYLLGATLHELLTGAPPHPGDSLWAVLASAYESAPYEYGPSVPRELASVCHRAMARDPEARFATALALRDALDEYLRHRGSLALCAAAEQRALELQQALAEPEGEARTARVRKAAAEADFGFRQALVAWDDNHDAIAGRQRCLALLLGFELTQRNAPGARALLHELTAAAPELVARVVALEAERAAEADAHARLARLGYEGSLAVSAGQRVAAYVVLFAALGLPFAVLGLRGAVLGYRGLLGLHGAVALIYLALLLGRRKRLLTTQANRRLQLTTVSALLLAIPLTAALWLAGCPVDGALIAYFFVYALVSVVLGIWAERLSLLLALNAVAPLLVCALWPGHGFYAFAALCGSALLVAIPRALLRRPAA